MKDEHRIHFTNNNQDTIGDNNHTNGVEISTMEHNILQMDLQKNKEGEDNVNRYFVHNVPNNQTSIENIQYNNINSQLEDVEFSDEEETGILNEYMKETEKVTKMYGDEEEELPAKYMPSKHEILERSEIPQPFEINENDQVAIIGNVDSIQFNQALVRANINEGILDLDNIAFNSNHIALGFIDDVIGNVEDPIYLVRFFPNIKAEELIREGEELFYVKTKAKQIIKAELLRKKGCDASNAFDEEVHENEMEFSDDEEETVHRKKEKNINKAVKRQKVDDTSYIERCVMNIKEKVTQPTNMQYNPRYSYDNSFNPMMMNTANMPYMNTSNNPFFLMNQNTMPQYTSFNINPNLPHTTAFNPNNLHNPNYQPNPGTINPQFNQANFNPSYNQFNVNPNNTNYIRQINPFMSSSSNQNNANK